MHGMSGTSTYISWKTMKDRCGDVNNKHYKDISYDPRWNLFENFLADMGKRPIGTTLERVDNTKGYSKDNCIWATKTAQDNNRSSTVKLTYNEETLSITQWAEKLNINRNLIYSRKRYHPKASVGFWLFQEEAQ